MSIKYFYVEDDTSTLFAANGTALTALLVGISNIAPLIKFPIPSFPMWLYFFGLIFAFSSKAMIQIINGDTLQREKLQNARDCMVKAEKESTLSPDLKAQIDNNWIKIEAKHNTLLKLHHLPRIDKLRAIFFFLSALCFLIATAMLIYLASYLALPSIKP